MPAAAAAVRGIRAISDRTSRVPKGALNPVGRRDWYTHVEESMLSLELPRSLEDRLEAIANTTGRSKQDCAAAAIARFIESEEDYQIAVERLKRNQPGIPLEEVERRLGLAD